MLDATERKTLAWCTFVAGVLCLIPGEQPKGPRPIDFALQVLGRVFEHRASQGAWALCLLFVVHHLWKSRKEKAAEKTPPPSLITPEAPADPVPATTEASLAQEGSQPAS